jgi:hypothetical protein
MSNDVFVTAPTSFVRVGFAPLKSMPRVVTCGVRPRASAPSEILAMSEELYDPFGELRNELNRTGVISKEFRDQILHLAMGCVSQGYGRALKHTAEACEFAGERSRAAILRRQIDPSFKL